MDRSLAAKAVSAACAALVVATFAHIALTWSGMPDSIPVHYGFDGSVDGWGGKPQTLVVPVIMLALCAGINVAERHPRWWNTGVEVTEENRERVYRILGNLLASMKLAIALGLAAVSAVQVEGGPQPWFLLPAMVAALVGVVAFWLAKLRKAR